ncbi:GNAT family N-acetyltransferase [Vreelandella nanhaiensis]|uniref:GNAT family N-acetyltransferase n=1 Tax=Vreelandella nanhaiensis TaxID=1258546 RepID=UPI001FED0444|nr:GNAT family N-acetyltransferase [Halomonas nanhaiensis]
MTIEDYDAAVALWLRTEDVRLRDADSRGGIDRYLQRNPGLSFVAEAEGKVVSTIMGGHDSHRGFIQHLAIAASHRNAGIGSKLVKLCLDALKNEGIQKSHLMILVETKRVSASGAIWVGSFERISRFTRLSTAAGRSVRASLYIFKCDKPNRYQALKMSLQPSM